MKPRLWYSLREIARETKLPIYTIRRYVRLGRLETLVIPPGNGRAHRVGPEAFEAFTRWLLTKETKEWLRTQGKR